MSGSLPHLRLRAAMKWKREIFHSTYRSPNHFKLLDVFSPLIKCSLFCDCLHWLIVFSAAASQGRAWESISPMCVCMYVCVYEWENEVDHACAHLVKACRYSSCLRCWESSFFSRDRRIQALARPTSVFISDILWICLRRHTMDRQKIDRQKHIKTGTLV